MGCLATSEKMSRVIGMASPVSDGGGEGCAVSKRRLVITAVLAGSSQSEVARTYGVSQGWISRLMARYRDEGEAVFEPRSRAPQSNPGATAPETVELVLRLRKQLTESGLSRPPSRPACGGAS